MKRLIGAAAIGISLVIVASSFVHPFGPVKGRRSDALLLSGAETNPTVTHLLERSCQNCHSERSEWPWYSYVAPLSWLTEHDVGHARDHMNLSRWNIYTKDRKVALLTAIGVEVRNHRMPLPAYLQLHPGARLSDVEIKQLSEWARSERRRLRNGDALKLKTATD